MNQIDPVLWIGDAQDGRNVAALEVNGITAVFNATMESDNWPPDFKARTPYLRLNQNDGTPIPAEKLDQFVAWYAVMHTLRPVPTVLIHCGAGVSRAATFAILWLMLRERWTWERAEQCVRISRPQIQPNPVLIASVMTWLTQMGWRPPT